jgi:hypothetical protein
MPDLEDTTPRHELDAVEALPDRTMLTLLSGIPTPMDTSGLAGFVQNAGAASGNAEQTAPIVQGLSSTPSLPTL